ncbi:MAG: phospholipid carrier-dependent glycosyltransferase [Acidobacteria bacterium]|nr:MAG: phospholipid carrier-dependent glycosyltransferase [Acidobacteriota bacterium]
MDEPTHTTVPENEAAETPTTTGSDSARRQEGRDSGDIGTRGGRLDVAVLLLPATLKLVVHLLTLRGYGLHGDELYYLACSDHLDWGYVDHPPLSVLLLKVFRLVLGDSTFSIRLLPALAGFGTVLLTGLLARRMGAGRFGQLLAAVCTMVAPLYLGIGHIFSVNAVDLLLWLAAFHVMISILNGGAGSNWLWLGIVAGLGLQNKLSMLFLGFALVVGLVLTRHRRVFRSPWPWFGGLVAGVLIVPQILWQMANAWPTLEFIHNAQTQKNVALPLLAFLREQIVQVHPFTFPFWVIGLFCLLLHPRMRPYRALGWCYLVLLAIFASQGGKAYYLGPVYTLLFAAGAVAAEQGLRRPWLRLALVLLLAAGGAATAPLALPVLPVESYIRYTEALGLKPSSGERFEEGALPSYFANMFGWDRLAGVVHSVYLSLPPEDRARCSILGQNYMQAGAIDYYGRRMGLPRGLAGHNSYWLWGFGKQSNEVMIIIGGNRKDIARAFGEIEERAVFRDPHIQPMHSNQPIYVVRKPKMSLAEIWPHLRFYI